MTFRVTGFIIHKKDFREADRLFTVYTREMGKIQAMGQGTRKLESKLAGNLELLNHAVFTIAKGKAVDRIATVDAIDSHEDIKKNLEKLVVALHCLEIVDRAVKWEHPDPALYGLLGELLRELQQCPDRMRGTCAQNFKKRFSALQGFGSSDSGFAELLSGSLKSQEYFNFLVKN